MSPSLRRGRVARKLVGWGSCASLLLALGIGGYLLARPGKPSALQRLAMASGPSRWTELRIDGLPHFPYDADAPGPKDPFGLLIDVYVALGAEDPTANRALAVYHLWRNELGDLERAFSFLQREPEGPDRWNLEAVAHLRAGEPAQALEKLEQAYEEAPSSEAIRFNRAAVMAMLPLETETKKAWAAFFASAADSPWRDEAIEKRVAMDRREEPSPNLGEERTKLKERILGLQDAKALQELLADTDALSLLETLSRNRDTFLSRGLEFRKRLSSEGWKRTARDGKSLSAAIDGAIAGKKTRPELERLVASPDPIVSVGALRGIAYLEIVAGNADRARAILRRIIEACELHGCLEESILAGSDLGTVEAEAGDFRAAERALDLAMQQLPEWAKFRRAEILTKKSYLAILSGAPREGLQYAMQAAGVHRRLDARDGYSSALSNIGVSLYNQRLLRSAAVLFSEASQRAKDIEQLDLVIRTHAFLGGSLSMLGRKAAAEAAFVESLSLGKEAGLEASLSEALRVVGLEYFYEGRTREALEYARDSLEIVERLGLERAKPRALNLAAMASFEEGENEEALAYLEEAIEIFNRIAERSPSRLARVRRESSFAGEVGHLAKVLGLRGEGSRAWDVLGGGKARAIDDDECRVAFAKTGRSSVGVWVGTPSGTHFEEHQEEDWLSRASPWAKGHCPDSTKRLTVLENPFTLVGVGAPLSRKERPDVAVVIARSGGTPWPRIKLSGTALVVHSPEPLVSDEPLPRLPGAAEEARLILGAIPGSIELAGSNAAPAQLKSLVERANFLHFGVHAEARLGAGAASYLWLAGENGLLQVVDVLGLPLGKKKPLVVLSACQVGGKVEEKESDGAGLPWAFLEAGASVVIATSERLDDKAAVDFSRVLYQSLAHGYEVWEAFELAVGSLRERWPPEVAGSYALYI